MDNTKDIKGCILSQLPLKWQQILNDRDFYGLEEIRFREFLPVMLYYSGNNVEKMPYLANREDLESLVLTICKNSVYAYRENIKEGFITLSGGHRVGLCGRGVLKSGQLYTLSHITGINIRIAREVKGCADEVLRRVLGEGTIKNTLIISPPSAGKTTMLRELARKASLRFKVCVIDERSEIAAVSEGGRGFDLGEQTDVFDGVLKKDAITMALRSLSPQVIVTDEIDTEADLLAVRQIMGAGAKIITSAHSEDFRDFERRNFDFLKLFDVLVLLSRKNGAGTVEEVRDVGSYYA